MMSQPLAWATWRNLIKPDPSGSFISSSDSRPNLSTGREQARAGANQPDAAADSGHRAESHRHLSKSIEKTGAVTDSV
jgi:hypothetical protein